MVFFLKNRLDRGLPSHIFNVPLSPPLYSSTACVGHSHRIFVPPFRRVQIYIFCPLSGFSPFVLCPSIRAVFQFALKAPPPSGRRGWKRPSYINSVAECRRDNNDLTAVRRSAFYRRCSCARGCSRESGVTIPVAGSPYRTLRAETTLALALFSQRYFSFSFNQYSPAAPYLLARLQTSVIGPFWRQLRDFSNRRRWLRENCEEKYRS